MLYYSSRLSDVLQSVKQRVLYYGHRVTVVLHCGWQVAKYNAGEQQKALHYSTEVEKQCITFIGKPVLQSGMDEVLVLYPVSGNEAL
jgi:hypothetical protein